MKNQIEIFKNNELGEVRTLFIDGEIYFLGNDVAKALEYIDLDQAIRKHVDPEDRKVLKYKASVKTTPALWSNKNDFSDKTLINESGMYALIFGSKLESAKKFKRWVTHDVLPSIRKHGAYITDELLQDNDRLNNVIAELQMENELKESRIEELEEVRTEYMKQRDKIIRIQIKCGNTKGNGRFIPYCILQLVREFIKDSENVEYRDDEIIKVNSRKLIRFVKGLFPKKYDAQSYLSQCLDINAWENVTVIPTNILEDEYKPIQDILY